MYEVLVLEGTLDEIAARADELPGHRLRVEVLAPDQRADGIGQTGIGGGTVIAPLVLEGTWDEICARADELRGRWLRVEAFTADQRGGSATPAPELPKAESRKGYLATPVILSDEAAATFAFYRPKGASKRVPFRKGGKRLPTVALEQRDEEAGRV